MTKYTRAHKFLNNTYPTYFLEKTFTRNRFSIPINGGGRVRLNYLKPILPYQSCSFMSGWGDANIFKTGIDYISQNIMLITFSSVYTEATWTIYNK